MGERVHGAIQSRFGRGSKKELNIEGSWERNFIDLEPLAGPVYVARDLLFTVLRGCRPFEDQLSLAIQVSWMLEAVWEASWSPKWPRVGSK